MYNVIFKYSCIINSVFKLYSNTGVGTLDKRDKQQTRLKCYSVCYCYQQEEKETEIRISRTQWCVSEE